MGQESSRAGVASRLLALLSTIPDPRAIRGRRFQLSALLAAVLCGILTGARGYWGIAEWLRDQSPSVWHWLGFTRKPPCANCFRNLLLAIDPAALEHVLTQWITSILGEPLPAELPAVCLDGKTLCGALAPHGRSLQLLSLLDQKTGCVLSQQAVPGDTNEAKTALELLKSLIVTGRVITGDAMFCQRDICQQIVDSGGDYLFTVKENQPELKAAIEDDFQPSFSPSQRKTA